MLITIKASPIHGLGLFATQPIPRGMVLASITSPHLEHTDLWYHLTPIGRKLNHSYNPNATITKTNQGGYMQHHMTTLREVEEGEELTVDYGTLQPGFEPLKPHYK